MNDYHFSNKVEVKNFKPIFISISLIGFFLCTTFMGRAQSIFWDFSGAEVELQNLGDPNNRLKEPGLRAGGYIIDIESDYTNPVVDNAVGSEALKFEISGESDGKKDRSEIVLVKDLDDHRAAFGNDIIWNFNLYTSGNTDYNTSRDIIIAQISQRGHNNRVLPFQLRYRRINGTHQVRPVMASNDGLIDNGVWTNLANGQNFIEIQIALIHKTYRPDQQAGDVVIRVNNRTIYNQTQFIGYSPGSSDGPGSNGSTVKAEATFKVATGIYSAVGVNQRIELRLDNISWSSIEPAFWSGNGSGWRQSTLLGNNFWIFFGESQWIWNESIGWAFWDHNIGSDQINLYIAKTQKWVYTSKSDRPWVFDYSNNQWWEDSDFDFEN